MNEGRGEGREEEKGVKSKAKVKVNQGKKKKKGICHMSTAGITCTKIARSKSKYIVVQKDANKITIFLKLYDPKSKKIKLRNAFFCLSCLSAFWGMYK